MYIKKVSVAHANDERMETTNATAKYGKIISEPNFARTNPKTAADKIAKAFERHQEFKDELRNSAQTQAFAGIASSNLKYSDILVSFAPVYHYLESISTKKKEEELKNAVTVMRATRLSLDFLEDIFKAVDVDAAVQAMTKSAINMFGAAREANAAVTLTLRNSDPKTISGAAIGYCASVGVMTTSVVTKLEPTMTVVLDSLNKAAKVASGDIKGLLSHGMDDMLEEMLEGVSKTVPEAIVSISRSFTEQHKDLEAYAAALNGFKGKGSDAKEWVEDFGDRLIKKATLGSLGKEGIRLPEVTYNAMSATAKVVVRYAEVGGKDMADTIDAVLGIGASIVPSIMSGESIDMALINAFMTLSPEQIKVVTGMMKLAESSGVLKMLKRRPSY